MTNNLINKLTNQHNDHYNHNGHHHHHHNHLNHNHNDHSHSHNHNYHHHHYSDHNHDHNYNNHDHNHHRNDEVHPCAASHNTKAPYADLHLHTTASDGSDTPTHLVQRVAREGFRAMAVTDHDTLDGLEEAEKEAKRQGIEFIPGIELSTLSGKKEIHILGYFVDLHKPHKPHNPHNPHNLHNPHSVHSRHSSHSSHSTHDSHSPLRDKLEQFIEARKKRAEKMVEKLNQLGYSISLERIWEIAGPENDYLGRPHIARALLERGYIEDISEAFTQKYIGSGGRAYVERFKITPAEAIALLQDQKSIPVLAHPGCLTDGSILEEADIAALVREGLQGLEVYYSMHDPDAQDYYLHLAQKYGLLITGGSDCHGEAGKDLLGSVKLPYNHVEDLFHEKHRRDKEC